MEDVRLLVKNNLEYFNIAVTVVLLMYVLYIVFAGSPSGALGYFIAFTMTAIGLVGIMGNVITKHPQLLQQKAA